MFSAVPEKSILVPQRYTLKKSWVIFFYPNPGLSLLGQLFGLFSQCLGICNYNIFSFVKSTWIIYNILSFWWFNQSPSLFQALWLLWLIDMKTFSLCYNFEFGIITNKGLKYLTLHVMSLYNILVSPFKLIWSLSFCPIFTFFEFLLYTGTKSVHLTYIRTLWQLLYLFFSLSQWGKHNDLSECQRICCHFIWYLLTC